MWASMGGYSRGTFGSGSGRGRPSKTCMYSIEGMGGGGGRCARESMDGYSRGAYGSGSEEDAYR